MQCGSTILFYTDSNFSMCMWLKGVVYFVVCAFWKELQLPNRLLNGQQILEGSSIIFRFLFEFLETLTS
jgi:hypothetical protein